MSATAICPFSCIISIIISSCVSCCSCPHLFNLCHLFLDQPLIIQMSRKHRCKSNWVGYFPYSYLYNMDSIFSPLTNNERHDISCVSSKEHHSLLSRYKTHTFVIYTWLLIAVACPIVFCCATNLNGITYLLALLVTGTLCCSSSIAPQTRTAIRCKVCESVSRSL